MHRPAERRKRREAKGTREGITRRIEYTRILRISAITSIETKSEMRDI